MSEKLKIEWRHDGQVLDLTLDSPKGNILDSEMMAAIHQALEGLEQKQSLKLIVWRAAGKHFCFGASVPEHRKEQAAEMLRSFHGIFRRLAELDVPTLAVVQGSCLGGGMELALYCHVIIAAANARFAQPEIILGVFPPPASVMLPLKAGQTVADDLVLTGRTVSATEAQKLGFVTHVVEPSEELDAFVEKWIGDHFLPKSASSLKLAARANRTMFNATLNQGLATVEALYLEELMATHDANEGIAAFLEKRSPTWKNR